MTTHEALQLQPRTAVHSTWALNADGMRPTGVASPDVNETIRVVWDDLAEPDSIVGKNDRMLLAAVAITQPTGEDGTRRLKPESPPNGNRP